MKVKLKNGIILESIDNGIYTFKPLQEVVKVDCACEICPLRDVRKDNNEFDCQVYGMFSGFYCSAETILQLLNL